MEKIAIVSASGRFPGADSLDEFFQHTLEGHVASRANPPQGWLVKAPSKDQSPIPATETYHHPRGFFLGDEDLLGDESLDPLNHLTLKVGLEAFDGAETSQVDLDRAGIIIGNIALPTRASAASACQMFNRPNGPWPSSEAFHLAAGPAYELAKSLGFGGTVYTLDAACASSLYAIRLAAQELQHHRADVMISGGISCPDSFYTQMGFTQLGALSPTGHSRPFDGRANGLMVGEGCGFFVLKRLSDALAHGDEILGLVASSGVSTDLAGSLLAPSSEGQVRAMQAAYHGELNPGMIDYVECHATGTPLGDAVEFQSLTELFQEAPSGSCVISSVKANIGHLLTAAGASSLMRVLWAIKEKTLPPTASFESASSGINLEGSPFRVLKKPEPWQTRNGQPRRAGINGFGFGGINAHLVIEEYQADSNTTFQPHQVESEVVIVGMSSMVGASNEPYTFGKDAEVAQMVGPEIQRQSFGALGISVGEFRIPPLELPEILPQQLAILKTSKDAVRDAGWDLAKSPQAGAFIGIQLDPAANHYHARWDALVNGSHQEECDDFCPALSPPRVMGALGGIVGSRVARELNCGGSGYTISADENSGIAALKVAFEAVKRGELTEAIVGAVDLISHPLGSTSDGALKFGPSAQAIRDGAVSMVLMAKDKALAEGLKIYGQIHEVKLDHLAEKTQTPKFDHGLVIDDFMTSPYLAQLGYLGAATGLAGLASALMGRQGMIQYGSSTVAGGYGTVTATSHGLEPEFLPVNQTAQHFPTGRRSQGQRAESSLAAPLQQTTPIQALVISQNPQAEDHPMFWHRLTKEFSQTLEAHTKAESAYLAFSQKALSNAGRLLDSLNMAEPGHHEMPTMDDPDVEEQDYLPQEIPTAPEPEVTSGLMLTPEGRAPFNPDPAWLDFNACQEFAAGKIGNVLGPKFAAIDNFPTRVRLPDGPLLLCHRIMDVDATPLSMKQGKLITEHDIHADAWYLDRGKIPLCIAVEAGQADLFLSAYLGADFTTQGHRVYRLLDAEVDFTGELPGPGKTIRYEIDIDHFFMQGDTTLFRFSFEATVDGAPFMSMKNGCAGFFSSDDLDRGRGIVKTALQLQPREGLKTGDFTWPVPVLGVESYRDQDLDSLRQGELGAFGEPFESRTLQKGALPGGMLKLVHRILRLDTTSGQYGLGMVVGEADIQPDDWFLTCHFVDDMVMPGTLMYECCLHTLRVYLQRIGWIGDDLAYEPIPGKASRLKCRGQVLASTKKVTYEITIKEIGYQPEAYVICDALMLADGKPIVQMDDMTLHHPGFTKDDVDELWGLPQASPTEETPREEDSSLLYTEQQIIDYAEGKISDCFGKAYDRFNQEGHCARLPRPPFLFVQGITFASKPPFVMEPGGSIMGYYQVPAAPWYQQEGGEDRSIPYCVTNEIALQGCGFHGAYMGSALTASHDLFFRNLGGTAIIHRPLRPDTFVKIHVESTDISSSMGMIIQNYSFKLLDEAGTIFSGDTVFGFFTKNALDQQVGIRDEKPVHPTSPPTLQDVTPDPRLSVSELLMLDKIDAYWASGGSRGLGYATASKVVDPTEWFFKAHFMGDPVMPGSLGLESFIQLLKFVASQVLDNVDIETLEVPLTGARHNWIYRGQVTPTASTVKVDLEVTDISHEDGTITADGYLSVDNLVIYKQEGFTLGVPKH